MVNTYAHQTALHIYMLHTYTHTYTHSHTGNVIMRYILIVIYDVMPSFGIFIIVCFYYLISREGSSSFERNNGARNQALPRSVARLVPKLFFVSKSREEARAYVDFPSRSEGKRNNGNVLQSRYPEHIAPKPRNFPPSLWTTLRGTVVTTKKNNIFMVRNVTSLIFSDERTKRKKTKEKRRIA